MRTERHAATLRFHRSDLGIPGTFNARVTAKRDILFSSGKVMYETVDSVTFRVTTVEHLDPDTYRTVRDGYRLIIFANGITVFDDRGRVCNKLAEAKAYLRRMAEDPTIAHYVFLALCGVEVDTLRHCPHETAMAALDDFYAARQARYERKAAADA